MDRKIYLISMIVFTAVFFLIDIKFDISKKIWGKLRKKIQMITCIIIWAVTLIVTQMIALTVPKFFGVNQDWTYIIAGFMVGIWAAFMPPFYEIDNK